MIEPSTLPQVEAGGEATSYRLQPCGGAGEHRRPLTITVVCMRSDEDHIVVRANMLRHMGNSVRILGLNDFGGGHVADFSLSVRTKFLERIFGRGALARLSRFADALRSDRADLWHVHYACGYHAFLAGALKCKPMVVSTMGGDILFDEQAGPTRLERSLTKLNLRTADLVTVKSEHSEEQVRDLGVRGDRVRRIVWGVDTRLYHPIEVSLARTELALPNAGKIVLSVRQLKPLYNIDIIVRAFQSIAREIAADASLYIMRHGADPAYESAIRELIHTIGLDERVFFVDPIEPERMPLWYAASDVVVGIPHSDGLPQTLLEAMACEKVTICPDDERYDQFAIHGVTAFRVSRESKSVAAAMSKALEDRTELRKMELAARALVVKNANMDSIAADVDACLRSVVVSNADSMRRRVKVFWWRALLWIGVWLVALAPRLAIPRASSKAPDRHSGRAA